MSSSAKERIKKIGMPPGSRGKMKIYKHNESLWIPRVDFDEYKKDGWIDSKEHSKISRRKNGLTKESNKGKKCIISPEGRRTYVYPEEIEHYVSLGYSSNKEVRQPHSEETIKNMRHSHKKIIDTSKMGQGNLKYVYIFDNEEYHITGLLEHLHSLGYGISGTGVNSLCAGKGTTYKKYPDLVDRIIIKKVGD